MKRKDGYVLPFTPTDHAEEWRTEAMGRVKAIILFAGFSFWIILTMMAFKAYPGSGILYVLFSSVSVAMWVSAWVGTKSYFYIFISSFWLLGFWMKTCVHVAFGLDYGEPIGAFNGSAEAWDHALTVATLAMCSAFLFRLSQLHIVRHHQNRLGFQADMGYVPRWYVRYGSWIWSFTLVIILCVAVVNFRWGVFQVGLMPHVLPFKLNALIAAALNLGFPLWVATIIWWDTCLGKPFLFRFGGAVFEAVVGSISVLSRGAYVFHVAHYFVSVGLNRKMMRLSWLTYAGVFFIVASGVIVTSLLTTHIRTEFYSGMSKPQLVVVRQGGSPRSIKQQPELQRTIQKNLAQYKIPPRIVWHNDFNQVMRGLGLSVAVSRMLTLFVDRWIGLEGVLAVSSYGKIGTGLFVNGWLEKRSLSTKMVFNYIANSIYVDPKNPNTGNFLFSSVPGLVAMLYYSGSYLVVFVGVFLFLSLVGLAEQFVSIATKNPFAVSFFSICMANQISQFGSLKQFVMQTVEIGIILGCVSLLQARDSSVSIH